MNKITDITEIYDYLDNLKNENYLVLIAIKDTIGIKTNGNLIEKFNEIGIARDLSKEYGHSYICVIDGCQCKYDSVGIKESESRYYFSQYGHDYGLVSRVYRNGNYSSITIDEKEYSVNSRGFNIVVFDKNQDRIIDSVCFDTHVSGYTCMRNLDYSGHVAPSIHMDSKIDASVSDILKRVNTLESTLSELKAQNERLQGLIEVKFQHNYMLHTINSIKSKESYDDARLRFFKKMPKATGDLRMLQLASKALLMKLDEVCRKENITYWIDDGTLLGAVRHEGFIPWDDDVDVGMMRKDIEKLMTAIAKYPDLEITECYRVFGGPHHNYAFNFKGIYSFRIDLFIHDWYADSSDLSWEEHQEYRIKLCKETQNLFKDVPNRDSSIPITGKKLTEVKKLIDKYMQIDTKKVSEADANAIVWSLDNVS